MKYLILSFFIFYCNKNSINPKIKTFFSLTNSSNFVISNPNPTPQTSNPIQITPTTQNNTTYILNINTTEIITTINISLNSTETLSITSTGLKSFQKKFNQAENFVVSIPNQVVGQFCSLSESSGIINSNKTIDLSCKEGNSNGNLSAGTIINPLSLNGNVTTLNITGSSPKVNGMTTDGRFLYPTYSSPNNIILKIDLSTNIATTIAGQNGVTGSADGIGTLASFNDPAASLYYNNFLFITELGGGRIRKIDLSNNQVSTILTGLSNPYGITTEGIYVYFFTYTRIGRIKISDNSLTYLAGTTSTGYADGIGTIARFNNDYGTIYHQNGIIYILDRLNCSLRTLDLSNNQVSTIAGSPPPTPNCTTTDGIGLSSRLEQAEGIGSDGTFLYIAQSGTSHIIRRFHISTNTLSYFSGLNGVSGNIDGSLINARFNQPSQISSDGRKLYVADYNNNLIRIID